LNILNNISKEDFYIEKAVGQMTYGFSVI